MKDEDIVKFFKGLGFIQSSQNHFVRPLKEISDMNFNLYIYKGLIYIIVSNNQTTSYKEFLRVEIPVENFPLNEDGLQLIREEMQRVWKREQDMFDFCLSIVE